ncbi:MAG: RNA polymerase sigma factor [Cytophagaceae bacterium]
MTTLEFTYGVQEALHKLKPAAFKLTRNTEEANDLLQETYVRAYNQKSKFMDGSNLNAWIYTIMRNIFINNYQRMVRRKTFLDSTDLQYLVNTPEKALNHRNNDHTLAGNEIRKALKKLTAEQRRPFLMYFTGYKYHEIADKLNIPLGTVKTRIYNARKTLQELLKDYALN